MTMRHLITLLMALATCTIAAAQCYYNTDAWLDDQGKHINAHGGGIIRVGDLWYWYGENRPHRGFTTEVGIEVYTSTDLTHWHDAGVALSVSEEEDSPIQRGCIMERPKVVFCPKTHQYVMLFHLELKGRGYEAAQVGFAVSDTPEGPFKFLYAMRPNAGKWPADWKKKDIHIAKQQETAQYPEWWTPEWRKAIVMGMFTHRDFGGGQMSRDMTVYIDEDGTAYHITSSEENLTIHIHELSEDYLQYTGRYWRVAPGGQNEAPTMLHRNGRYWLICSGCTGWAPNEARMFVADRITGPYTQVHSPMQGPGARKTFGAQGTYILRTDTADIFMADIWNPRHLDESRHLWIPITYASDGTPQIKMPTTQAPAEL